MNKFVLIITILFEFQFIYLNINAQSNITSKHNYFSFYKGIMHQNTQALVETYSNVNTNLSQFTGSGLAYGYTLHPRLNLELQYQYIDLMKARSYKGEKIDYYNDDHQTTSNSNNNEIKTEIYFIEAMIKWNYFRLDNLFSGKIINGNFFMTFGLGDGYSFINSEFKTDNTVTKENKIFHKGLFFMPFSFSYQYKDFVFSYNYIYWGAYVGKQVDLTQIGLSYYFW